MIRAQVKPGLDGRYLNRLRVDIGFGFGPLLYIVLICRPDPHHQGSGRVETLLVDLRDHDVLQLVHHLVEVLLVVRSWDSPPKILTKSIVELKVELLGK